jgi:hypothetical protein
MPASPRKFPPENDAGQDDTARGRVILKTVELTRRTEAPVNVPFTRADTDAVALVTEEMVSVSPVIRPCCAAALISILFVLLPYLVTEVRATDVSPVAADPVCA